MQKNLKFNLAHTLKITEETIRGVLLNFRPMKEDPADATKDIVCDISDLNEVSIDVVLKRGKKEIVMFEGYLMDYILGLYAQSGKYALNIKKTAEGYLTFIDFTPSVIRLSGDDELVVKIKADKKAFTGTVESKSNIEFHTMPAIGATPTVPVVKSHPIEISSSSIDVDLGNRVKKIVCATDFTTDYLSSDKAKIESGTLQANNFEKPFTENQLLAENMQYFDNNPESDVEDLVIYWGDPLNRVKLRAKLTKPAEQGAKILAVSVRSAY